LGTYPGVFLDVLVKNTKDHAQDSLFPSRDWKQVYPEYKALSVDQPARSQHVIIFLNTTETSSCKVTLLDPLILSRDFGVIIHGFWIDDRIYSVAAHS
jgi:hypothetical protein